jgi:hypothetical protein
LPNLGPIFRTFFPQKCWEKIDFSAEKVLKNHFFPEIPRKITFRGKFFRKIGPWSQTYDFELQLTTPLVA